ncbi:right-handed parallel beta-helix repeat-containing protein [Citricoccus zhacaiensis]|uniref:right-handed parallel beta-helix repeat-containing protein n=2 Tax=Citricoccus zhacaiensis TaxID=489142 RepID=UPI001668C455|nr:right-handed parallel beta-helix repeat-containing protein [Citricoccus zhacaiensis]
MAPKAPNASSGHWLSNPIRMALRTPNIHLRTANAGIRFAPGSKIKTTVTIGDTLTITGAGASVEGGTIESAAAWDVINAIPTFAVVHVKAEDVRIAGLLLVNVPKVGICFADVKTGTVEGCRIAGNYPASGWTGSETGHFGIAYNPHGVDAGRLVITDNHIKSYLQGMFMEAYGGPDPAYGIVMSSNIFDGCHNHGIYSSFDLNAVAGNSFTRCSMHVALTGRGHVVTGNTR